jgi:RNA polymerase sigma factor (sigma-70 family)
MSKQRQENLERYARLRSGDATAAAELMLKNLPLVVAQADQFLERYPANARLRDDLIACGNLALVTAVRWLEKPHDEILKLNQYLIKCLRLAFRECCQQDPLVGPGSSAKKMRKHRGVDPDKFQDPQHDPEFKIETLTGREIPAADELIAGETLDALLGCCLSDFERQLVVLRSQELVDAEIAERLGSSKDTVHRARLKIRTRYHEQYLALGA